MDNHHRLNFSMPMTDTLEMFEWMRRSDIMRTLLEIQKLDALHAGDEPTAQQCIVELHQLENNE